MKICAACARHVRDVDSVCPFCGATADAIDTARRRRVRRAVLLGAAAIGAACGGTTTPDDGGATDAKQDQAQQQDVGAVPPYGVPPFDGGTE